MNIQKTISAIGIFITAYFMGVFATSGVLGLNFLTLSLYVGLAIFTTCLIGREVGHE